MRMTQVTAIVLASASLALAVDSVHVTPVKPTTRDSLTLELYLGDRCCATRYYRDTAMQYDTTILLSYEYDDSLCAYIHCLVPGSRYTFKMGPVRAGTYGIYKLEVQYCPGPICPLGPIIQRRVGEVTVSTPTAASRMQRVTSVPATRPGLRFEDGAGRVSVVASGHSGMQDRRCTIEGRLLRAPAR